MRLIDLDAPRAMLLDLHGRFEVRHYPDLGDTQTYTETIYTTGALVSNARGVICLAIEHTTDDGRTEVLRIRLLSVDDKAESGENRASS